ncbi:MAG: MOSC domain-containing protein [Gammaproteobacteria bacterium]|jgi:MOSC domain-containing protein YiiM
MQLTFKALQGSLPHTGSVKAIFIRPEKYSQPHAASDVYVSLENGISGDHFKSHSKKRQVTLIQFEHLAVIAKLLHKDSIDPSLLRRNIVVAGVNLLALKDKVFAIGDVQLRMTGLCHPCSRMEKALGPGGYNAVRGHGGITATVIKAGKISIGDSVHAIAGSGDS